MSALRVSSRRRAPNRELFGALCACRAVKRSAVRTAVRASWAQSFCLPKEARATTAAAPSGPRATARRPAGHSDIYLDTADRCGHMVRVTAPARHRFFVEVAEFGDCPQRRGPRRADACSPVRARPRDRGLYSAHPDVSFYSDRRAAYGSSRPRTR